MNEMREWFSPSDLAELRLPGMPETRSAIAALADAQGWRLPASEFPVNPNGVWRKRAGRGGGFEYRPDVLPLSARAKLVYEATTKAPKSATTPSDAEIQERWTWYDRLPERKKQKAGAAVSALRAVRELERAGTSRTTARSMIASQHGVSVRTLFLWEEKIASVPQPHWLVFLAPRHVGKTEIAECSPEAWSAFCTDYLRGNAPPNFTDCYRRLERLAKKNDWIIPTASSLRRKVEREIPPQVLILTREGEEALKRTYPALQRDRTIFHAMEAVNADTHKWDVFVLFPGDKKGTRAQIIAFQDLYSGKILSWRITKNECREVMLLAIHDMIDTYGVPDICFLDNSGTFTSKWITGGMSFRYKWKVKENEPTGIMKMLGIEVHWTKPYSGQSKPIERAFRDFAQSIARHPAFAGAWTGNTVANAPEDRGAKSVPLDVFERVVAEEIAEHNARIGRRTGVCKDRKLSFDQAFEESYAKDTTLVKKATAEQKRLCLLGAEGVSVQQHGHIEFMENRYWAEDLLGIQKSKVIIRFDPEDLYAGVHVYRLDGAFHCFAECQEKVGFLTTDHGRAFERTRRAYNVAQKKMAEALKGGWTIEKYAAATASESGLLPAPLPEKRTVRMVANGGFEPHSNEFDEAFARGVEMQERGQIIEFPKEKGGR